eukprot:COSAG01_NODE_7357_length_3235_cov_8.278521_3_plen_60_part_01
MTNKPLSPLRYIIWIIYLRYEEAELEAKKTELQGKEAELASSPVDLHLHYAQGVTSALSA